MFEGFKDSYVAKYFGPQDHIEHHTCGIPRSEQYAWSHTGVDYNVTLIAQRSPPR